MCCLRGCTETGPDYSGLRVVIGDVIGGRGSTTWRENFEFRFALLSAGYRDE